LYSTCLFCTKNLGTNDVVETLPIGRRLAFDAAQGRLWVVCRHCAKWNLVPFESRLESIDACERLFRDTPTRYSTDNIGLARVKEGLELVRIGRAQRPEFAGWRYGEEVRRRRRRNVALLGGGAALIGGGALAAGMTAGLTLATIPFGIQGVQMAWSVFRVARGRLVVVDPSGASRRTLWKHQLDGAMFAWKEGEPVLRVEAVLGKKIEWKGDDVPRIGQRILARLNRLAGNGAAIDAATSLLGQHNGDLSGLMTARSREQRAFDSRTGSSPVFAANRAEYWYGYGDPMLRVGHLPVAERLAIEMYFAESAERTWLEGELTLLEREWRQAEELAKISDGLALPETADEELAKRKGSAQP